MNIISRRLFYPGNLFIFLSVLEWIWGICPDILRCSPSEGAQRPSGRWQTRRETVGSPCCCCCNIENTVNRATLSCLVWISDWNIWEASDLLPDALVNMWTEDRKKDREELSNWKIWHFCVFHSKNIYFLGFLSSFVLLCSFELCYRPGQGEYVSICFQIRTELAH